MAGSMTKLWIFLYRVNLMNGGFFEKQKLSSLSALRR